MEKQITINTILEYYDIPQLFVGTDNVNTRYLCMLFDDTEQYSYIAVPVSPRRLNLFLAGKLDLREIYTNPEISFEYYIATPCEQRFQLHPYHTDTLPEEMLPCEGYLYAPSDENDTITQEMTEYLHPIIHLGFEDTNNSHDINAICLSDILKEYQSMVINCFRKEGGNKRSTDPRLRLFNTSAASFNLHLYAEAPLGLFNISSIDRTLHSIDKLMKCSNENELKQMAETLKGHTISSYKNFVKKLIDNELSVKYGWFDSLSENKIINTKIQLPQLHQIYEILVKSSELAKEIKEFDGILIGLNTEKGTWNLELIDGNNIKGTTENPTLLHGLTSKKEYHIICEEIIEQIDISLKEKSTLKLISIQEI